MSPALRKPGTHHLANYENVFFGVVLGCPFISHYLYTSIFYVLQEKAAFSK